MNEKKKNDQKEDVNLEKVIDIMNRIMKNDDEHKDEEERKTSIPKVTLVSDDPNQKEEKKMEITAPMIVKTKEEIKFSKVIYTIPTVIKVAEVKKENQRVKRNSSVVSKPKVQTYKTISVNVYHPIIHTIPVDIKVAEVKKVPYIVSEVKKDIQSLPVEGKKQLKEEKNNTEKLKKEKNYKKQLENIYIKIKGTSKNALLLGIIVQLIIGLIGIASIMRIHNIPHNLVSKKNTSIKKEITYDGSLMYNTSIHMKDQFTIEVPSKFENQSSDHDYHYEYNTEVGIFNRCSVTLTVPEGYSSAEKLISEIEKYNEKNKLTTVAKQKINNIQWHHFSYQDEFGMTYYYATTKKDKVYLLEYQIQEESGDECITYKDNIIYSIKSK